MRGGTSGANQQCKKSVFSGSFSPATVAAVGAGAVLRNQSRSFGRLRIRPMVREDVEGVTRLRMELLEELDEVIADHERGA
jgi:hypothetical protein